MTLDQFVERADNQVCFVRCPDGTERKVWGYNKQTGDVFVSGWSGHVFIDATNRDKIAVTFK